MMDCRTARSLLDMARPGCAELHASEADALDRHLNSCSECDVLFRQERHIDAHIGKAVSDVPVPQGLRDRVMVRLTRARRAMLRERVARLGSLAAAAVVFLAMSLAGWSKWVHPLQLQVNLEELQYYVASQPTNGDALPEWYKTHHGDAVSGPPDINGQLLNYNLLAFCGLVDLQGRQTPMLLFVNEDKRARIYVLSHDQFDITPQKLPRGAQTPSMGVKVEVFNGPDPKTAYIIIYTDTAEGLKPFLVGSGNSG